MEKTRVVNARTDKESLAVGDVVFLKEDTSRCLWRMAKIEELIPGRDGKIRSAKIRVLTKETKKPIILRRPIQLLVPTEVKGENEHNTLAEHHNWCQRRECRKCVNLFHNLFNYA